MSVISVVSMSRLGTTKIDVKMLHDGAPRHLVVEQRGSAIAMLEGDLDWAVENGREMRRLATVVKAFSHGEVAFPVPL
jgi:hypothetical protein